MASHGQPQAMQRAPMCATAGALLDIAGIRRLSAIGLLQTAPACFAPLHRCGDVAESRSVVMAGVCSKLAEGVHHGRGARG